MDFSACQRKFTSEFDLFQESDQIEAQLGGLNVDDGLSAQDNATFLLASMAFLQQHAKRKLSAWSDRDSDTPDYPTGRKKFKRTYSNMLLFETPAFGGEGKKERFYLKLKNSAMYEDVVRKETCLEPNTALSRDQLLPLKVKNPKRFPNLFKTISKTGSKRASFKRKMDDVSPRNSFFSLFKSGRSKKIKVTGECHVQDADLDDDRTFVEDWTCKSDQKCEHDPRQQEELRFISEMSIDKDKSLIKNSIHQKLRSRLPDSSTAVADFSTNESSVRNIHKREPIKILSHEYYYTNKGSPPRDVVNFRKTKKLSRPLSKISVCFEESDTDDGTHRAHKYPNRGDERMGIVSAAQGEVTQTQSQISGFSNFSDELKANLSPEVLKNIISEVIVFLEDAPNAKCH